MPDRKVRQGVKKTERSSRLPKRTVATRRTRRRSADLTTTEPDRSLSFSPTPPNSSTRTRRASSSRGPTRSAKRTSTSRTPSSNVSSSRRSTTAARIANPATERATAPNIVPHTRNPHKLQGRRKENRGGYRGITAGRKTQPGTEVCPSNVRARSAIIRREINARDDFEAFRKAFIKEVEQRFSKEAATVVENITSAEGHGKAQEVLRKWERKEPEPLDADDCLAFYLTLDFTKHKYLNVVKVVNKAAGMPILKCYETVRKAKAQCLPPQGITITELSAKTNLQDLIAHTIIRTAKAYDEQIGRSLLLRGVGITCATMTFTWGFDGASGQRMFKMPYHDPASEDRCDSALFAVVLTAIKLNDSDGNTLWNNPNPQSANSVRPILLEFERETHEYVEDVKDEVDAKIRSLRPVAVDVGNEKQLQVQSKMLLTLIDGKGFNIITNTASSRCPVCKSGRNQINDFRNHGTAVFAPKDDGLDHGVQAMHGWIKFADHLFSLAYKIPLWEKLDAGVRVRNPEQLKMETKQRIQNVYRREKGLRIDMPAQFGSGNTMDGNTSRRVLRDYMFFSATTGIPADLVKRYYVILCVINSVYYLPKEELEEYCFETLTLFKQRYPRFTVTPSVHKIMEHSYQVSQHMGIPQGVVAEGGSEAAHLRRKLARLNHTRKSKGDKHMQDLHTWDMCRSDPVIAAKSNLIASPYKKSELESARDLPAEARRLLQIPQAILDQIAPENDGIPVAEDSSEEYD